MSQQHKENLSERINKFEKYRLMRLFGMENLPHL